jgi:hypothetical protein
LAAADAIQTGKEPCGTQQDRKRKCDKQDAHEFFSSR